jgi:hypothetical protein
MAAIELSDVEDDESGLGPAESTGDLFAEAEAETPEIPDVPEAVAQVSEAVTIPTAEPSQEAAEDAQALVERLNAEEVEVSS